MAEARLVQGGTKEETEKADLLRTLVALGDPEPWVSGYLKIETDGSDGKGTQIVPMRFVSEPNQVFYHRRLFSGSVWEREHPGLEWQPWVVDVLVLKDRKARWTSYWTAVLFAKMACVPGTHVLCITDAEDTFLPVNKFLSGYYNNLPGWMRPELKGGVWAQESNTFIFKTNDGGEMTSTFTIRTSNSANVGTGVTPTDVVLEEYGKFGATFSASAQASFRASMPAGTSFWRGGTVGPAGSDCAMYEEIQQKKDGLRNLDYLFTTWFMNPANALPSRHRDRRPADLEDKWIEPGVNAGPYGEQEEALIAQFPQDGTPWQWRIARRRSWMNEAYLAAGSDKSRAQTLFQREHCENDQAPWQIEGITQFDRELLDRYAGIVAVPTYLTLIDRSMGALRLQAWKRYDPSHVYIMGLDLGSGSGGDDTSGQIMDFTANHAYIGELHGAVTDPVNAVAQAVAVMREWGNGILVIENNRFPGIADYAHRAPTFLKVQGRNAEGQFIESELFILDDTGLGYENTWKPPRRQDEDYDAYRKRHYGMNSQGTSHGPLEPSAEEMNANFKSEFNLGNLPILNPNLHRTMQKWNPALQKHTPDRIAGARLCPLAYDAARKLQPVTGAQVLFHGHQPPKFKAVGLPRPFRVA